jgi:hypothetical protein
MPKRLIVLELVLVLVLGAVAEVRQLLNSRFASA